MKRLIHRIAGVLFLMIMSGCVSPQLNVVTAAGQAESIRTIALAPNGGVLADAVGFELIKLGFEVFDTTQVNSLMVRMNFTEMEILEPQNLLKLKEKGIDGILQVKAVSGYDGRPQSASVKVVSTVTSRIIAGATWQNGRSGAQGSMADQDARVDMVAAARQIAQGLTDAVSIRKSRR